MVTSNHASVGYAVVFEMFALWVIGLAILVILNVAIARIVRISSETQFKPDVRMSFLNSLSYTLVIIMDILLCFALYLGPQNKYAFTVCYLILTGLYGVSQVLFSDI
jgi:hypothetical protein